MLTQYLMVLVLIVEGILLVPLLDLIYYISAF